MRWNYDTKRHYRSDLERFLQLGGKDLADFYDCDRARLRELVREAAGDRATGFVINLYLETALFEGVRRHDYDSIDWYRSVVPFEFTVRRHRTELPVFPHVLLTAVEPWDDEALGQIDACIEALLPEWMRAYDARTSPGRAARLLAGLAHDRDVLGYEYYPELTEAVPRFIRGWEAAAR